MFYRKSSVILIMVLILLNSKMFSQDYNWAKGFGAGNADYGHALISDSKGNIYMTGEFYTSLTFTPLPAVTSYGNVDYFLVKLDSVGNGKWVRKGGGTLTDRGFGVKFDNDGNVVTSGVLYGISTFEGGNNPNVILTSAGNLDGFVAKYDTAGNLLWIRQALSVSQVSLRQVAIDNQGNITAAGYFGTTGTDTVRIDTVTVYGNGQRDAFIVKLNSSGNALWGRSMGSSSSTEEAKGIVVDNNNNIYVTGFFMGTGNFSGTQLVSNGGEDIFVAKYSPSGSLVWAKNFGGLKNDEGYSILLDNSGNLIIGGTFDSAAVFGSFNVTGFGAYDAFVAKLDPNGNVLWIKSGGSAEAEYGYMLAKDVSGNFYQSGSFRATANFSGQQMISAGAEDAFVAKYDGNGNLLLLRQGGGTGQDRAYGLNIDAGGNILFSGRFNGSATFGTTTLTSNGADDLFIAKIGNNALPVELISFTAEAVNNKVNLKWTTATELNNQGFYIERCSDNINFGSIAFIKGHGNSTNTLNYSFTDNSAAKSGKYYYRLKQVDFDGTLSFSPVVEVNVNPQDYALFQNYPNPFNPVTRIDYQLAFNSKVKLELYNVNGELLSVLLNSDEPAGYYSIELNLNSIKNVSSGVYFYKLTAIDKVSGRNFTDTKKLIYMK